MTPLSVRSLVAGMIVTWAGSILDIPDGFALCDGNNGTPDLRNRFIVGAGDTYAQDDSGGTSTHRHLFGSDGHDHDLIAGSGLIAGGDFDTTTSLNQFVGFSDYVNNLPPYYALAYVMQL